MDMIRAFETQIIGRIMSWLTNIRRTGLLILSVMPQILQLIGHINCYLWSIGACLSCQLFFKFDYPKIIVVILA